MYSLKHAVETAKEKRQEMFLGVPVSASRAHAAGQTGRVDLGSLWGLGGPPLPLCLFVLHPSCNVISSYAPLTLNQRQLVAIEQVAQHDMPKAQHQQQAGVMLLVSTSSAAAVL